MHVHDAMRLMTSGVENRGYTESDESGLDRPRSHSIAWNLRSKRIVSSRRRDLVSFIHHIFVQRIVLPMVGLMQRSPLPLHAYGLMHVRAQILRSSGVNGTWDTIVL